MRVRVNPQRQQSLTNPHNLLSWLQFFCEICNYQGNDNFSNEVRELVAWKLKA